MVPKRGNAFDAAAVGLGAGGVKVFRGVQIEGKHLL
jgi:hypothetical protein